MCESCYDIQMRRDTAQALGAGLLFGLCGCVVEDNPEFLAATQGGELETGGLAATSGDPVGSTSGDPVGSTSVGEGDSSGSSDGVDECGGSLFSNFKLEDLRVFGTGTITVGGDGVPTEWILNTETGNLYEPVYAAPDIQIRAAGEGVLEGIGFEVVTNAGPTPLAIVTMETLDIEFGGILHAVGRHPLVLVTNADTNIEGELSVASSWGFQGAGGALGGLPPALGGEGPGGASGGNLPPKGEVPGGGGGGGGTFGGPGGTGSSPIRGGGGLPGTPYGSVKLEPLLAGSGGAAGSSSASGGAGGGALQLVSRTSIVVSGRLDAGGSGAQTGGGGSAGAGGGSGGALLIEAPFVAVTGLLGANGGAGIGNNQSAGDNGSAALVPALDVTYGRGGAGSDADGVAGDGTLLPGAVSGSGGGGGAGRIRINTDVAATSFVGQMITPSLESGLATVGPLGCATGGS